MVAAILSAVSNAFELVVDKTILTKERVTLRVFLPILFILLFLFTLVLVPWLGHVDWQVVFLTNTMFLTFLMVVLAIAWNVLLYQSIQREKVHQHEMVMMLTPLVTIVLAAIFYPEELNTKVLILALLASVTLFFAKGQKEHFFIDRNSYNTLLGVILMSAETMIVRELLFSYTPVALYAIRTAFLALFFAFYYRPRYGGVSKKHWSLISVSAFVGVVQMIAKYYAFSEFGIVLTTLITILSPIIVFFFSWEVLHERIKPRMVIASLIILACVVLGMYFSFAQM